MRIWRTMVPRGGALALVFGALLSACQVDVQEPRPVPPDGGGYCTREYAPVCARRGSRYETFSNSCMAEDQGYRVISAGECGQGGYPPDEPSCPKNYDPVCASRGNSQRTFSNSCSAEESGFRVDYSGACVADGGGNGGPQMACNSQYAPVCGRRGSQVQTFDNKCEAGNAGFRVIADGPC